MKLAIKKVAIAILLASSCANVFASPSWAQDEIIVKPKGTDHYGRVVPNELSYQFSYREDQLSAVHMLFGDKNNNFNAIVGSHYFKYAYGADGKKRLKAIMLFSQGRENATGSKEQISGKYNLYEKAKSPTFPMSGKWILVVAERDKLGRATVVNKFGIDDRFLLAVQKNAYSTKLPFDESDGAGLDANTAIRKGLEKLVDYINEFPLNGINFDDPYIGSPIGTFVITYKDSKSTDFKEVRTYSLSSAQCSTCALPPAQIKKPIKNYLYEPKISYVWDYMGNGDFTTTFNYFMTDSSPERKVAPFYQQEIKVEDINPDSGRVGRIMEYANNVYNLYHQPQPVPMYEYILKDEGHANSIVDEYLFGLSMMGIGVPQEEHRDINFASIISASPDSGVDGGDNLVTNTLVKYLDKRFNGLGSLISQVGSFSSSAK